MRSRSPRINPPVNRHEMRNRLRQLIPWFSICSVMPPPHPSMRSTRRTGWSGFTRCSATRRAFPTGLLSAEASADAVHWLRDSGLGRAISPADVQHSRLSLERTQFFFVGSSTSREPSLSNFFETYCRKTLVQQLDMEPQRSLRSCVRAGRNRPRRGHPRTADTASPLRSGRADDLHQLHA